MASINDMYGLGGTMGGLASSQLGQFMDEQEYMRRKMAEAYVQGAGQQPEKKDESKLLLLLED